MVVVLINRRRASLWIIGILTILSMIFVISFNRSSMKDFVGIYSSSVLSSDDGDFSGGGSGSSDRESTIVGEEGDDDDEVKTAKNADTAQTRKRSNSLIPGIAGVNVYVCAQLYYMACV